MAIKKIIPLLLLVLSAAYANLTQCTNQQRNLAIMVDFTYADVERADSPLSTSLYHLLLDQRSFILINEAVWNAYIKCVQKNNIDYSSFYEHWQTYTKDNFILLIPNRYIEQMGSVPVGLHCDNLLPTPLDFKTSLLTRINDNCKYFMYGIFPGMLSLRSGELIAFLKQLCVSKKDLPSITWNIFFLGHGGTVYQTAGITEDGFNQFVELLDNHINTHAFFYLTCFGGKIKDYIFNKSYSFPIFCVGINDTQTCALITDYHSFFDSIERIDNKDINTSYNFAETAFRLCQSNPNDIISMRVPSSNSFVTPTIKNKTCVISGPTLPKNYNSYAYLILDTPQCKEELYLWGEYKNRLPAELKLAGECDFFYRHPKIISASKGSFNHYLEKITTNVPYNALFKSFYDDHLGIASYKNILINEMDCCAPTHHNEYKSKDTTVLKNIIISRSPSDTLPHSDRVFFLRDNQGYYLNIEVVNISDEIVVLSTLKKLSLHETKKNIKKFKRLKNSIEKGEQPTEIIEHSCLKRLYPWLVSGTILTLSTFISYLEALLLAVIV